MINHLRTILHKNPLMYKYAALIYHEAKLLFQTLIYGVRGVRVYRPIIGACDGCQSQYGQEYILDKKLCLLSSGGFFIEVGANSPKLGSNTWYLEHIKGWHGISVDPLDYSQEYERERPNTHFICAAIDCSRSEVVLNLVEKSEGWEDKVSTLSDKIYSHGRGFRVRQTTVPAITLKEVCKDITHIDLLLLDVEGHELNVLQSFDWDRRIRPKIILCENTGDFFPRRRLEEYLALKGYRLRARVGTADDIYIDESK